MSEGIKIEVDSFVASFTKIDLVIGAAVKLRGRVNKE
jgi:hypothetical protein